MKSIDKPSKNGLLLGDFALYCLNHPDQRFWQALRNWCNWNFVYVSDTGPSGIDGERHLVDTFYMEGK